MVSFTVFKKITSVTVSSSTKNLWQLDQLSRLWMIVLSFTHIQDTCLPINGLKVNVFVFSKKKRERERDQKFYSRPSISSVHIWLFILLQWLSTVFLKGHKEDSGNFVWWTTLAPEVDFCASYVDKLIIDLIQRKN